jgi:hypothetical protein
MEEYLSDYLNLKTEPTIEFKANRFENIPKELSISRNRW